MNATTSKPTPSTTPNPLNERYQRFDIDLFRSHSHELGRAANAIEHAYQTAYALECITSILAADEIERDREDEGGQPLSLYLRGGLSVAVATLVTRLRSELDREGTALERMVKSKQGGLS
ncbi:hypothetical protein [Noviherbaspirillum malthae]|uniref:hypothetical protein n=1 Tax=Noviherbaspirillum malthae TaxID=1260987 RepID=UPI00188FFA0D|nr:hypothetical protein [Noviherbaspirillum malthae]